MSFLITPNGRRALNEESAQIDEQYGSVDLDAPMTLHELEHHRDNHEELHRQVRTLANQAAGRGLGGHAKVLHGIADDIETRMFGLSKRAQKLRKIPVGKYPEVPRG